MTHDSGIKIESGEFKFIIDPSRKIDNSLIGISHAHSDHLRSHTGKIISTEQTSDFFNFSADKFNLEYNDVIKVKDHEISLHNANHILGSSQFKVQNSEVLVYSGDFRLHESVFFPTCELIDCDTLIIESTYGRPDYCFPEHASVIEDMKKWTKTNEGNNIIFGAYKLGKSQEVVKILNDMDIVPVVHPDIAANCGVYNTHGFSLEFLSSDSAEAIEVMRDDFVTVLPPHLLKKHIREVFNFQNKKKTAVGNVTGWNFRRGADRVFHLSDHADFKQLTEYIEACSPKRVYTVHGFEQDLANHINKKLGIPAKPLKSKQALLSDY